MRWKIHLSYLGTNYSGWQRQPNATSVQQTLEEAFALVLRQPVEIVGCGRTDAGVHAREYVAHADVNGIPFRQNCLSDQFSIANGYFHRAHHWNKQYFSCAI